MTRYFPPAPELDVSDWLNVSEPLSLASLKGKVVVIHAFQMLCPGCVVHGIPQTRALYELYGKRDDVQIIGLHSVFEHHEVMGRAALEAFIHEYRLSFPIAIDRPEEGGVIPATMRKYQLQGTPSLVVIDKSGHIRLNYFGRMPDLNVGSFIGELIGADAEQTNPSETAEKRSVCDDNGCLL